MIIFRKASMPPVMSPAMGLVPYMTPAKKQNLIDTTFDQIGGQDAFVEEARADKKWFYEKFWLRNVPRPATVEHTAGTNLEALLELAHKGENAKVISGDFTEIKDAPE